ncbi:MAG: 16S rRNA (cytosine(1402)-N(4))-methyltransferase RsmH [Bdellovibrionaceae bacterium]|nr:16S rRNA (cytosine(1402)-N(4))-methyltransferase RsmH [Pseudobdellovibrionaceae bacterium]
MSAEIPSEIHIPVMLQEIIDAFAPLKERGEPLRYFDGTLGRGGHLRAILENMPQVRAVGLDQDPSAIKFVENALAPEIAQGRLTLVRGTFHEFDPATLGEFDMMLLDLGVSSPQLDQPQRGFSFYYDGPLDMRMNPDAGPTAADFVNTWSDAELYKVFKEYGEIFKPSRVVNEIVRARKEKPFTSTFDLSKLIERVEGWRRKGFHPATPYFMALRILVNNELQGLEDNLPRLLTGLRPGGRLAVLTFHSLEDRIVKNILRGATEIGRPVNKKVIVPTREEELRNPRSRSAKLRVFERQMAESHLLERQDGVTDAADLAMDRKGPTRVE